jgi:hypothetical protein
MLSQRVANIADVIAIENSTFGYINERKHMWGGHVGNTYTKPEPGLPIGIAPAAAQFYVRAIQEGYFVV